MRAPCYMQARQSQAAKRRQSQDSGTQQAKSQAHIGRSSMQPLQATSQPTPEARNSPLPRQSRPGHWPRQTTRRPTALAWRAAFLEAKNRTAMNIFAANGGSALKDTACRHAPRLQGARERTFSAWKNAPKTGRGGLLSGKSAQRFRRHAHHRGRNRTTSAPAFQPSWWQLSFSPCFSQEGC